MKVKNHNGAEMGTIEDDGMIDQYLLFEPKKGWRYTAYQLEVIAQKMRKVEE